MISVPILSFILIFNLFIPVFSQSALSIASDNSLCSCNLTPNSCDINCCCDTDCSNELKRQFSACITNIIVTNDRVCSYPSISYDPVTKQQITQTISSKNGFCIYNNNYFQSSFYTSRNVITSAAELNSNIAASLPRAVIGTPVVPTQNIPRNITSQFPAGFKLSGNIGYEIGKPVMRAIVNNQILNIANDPNQWWPLKSGDNCETSTTTESVTFGINIMTGCSLTTNDTCGALRDKSNLYLQQEPDLSSYRIASFANMNITNLNNWVNIITTNNQPTGAGCLIVTTRIYEVLYARTGRTTYLHNKIVGVRTQSIFSSVSENTNSNVFLKTIVNFIDVTPSRLVATKLSPFLTIRLPYDFFYPIYEL